MGHPRAAHRGACAGRARGLGCTRDQGARCREVQRAVPLDGSQVCQRVAQDRHAHGPLGRFRPRLQDDGLRVHGERVVGVQAAVGAGASIQVPQDNAIQLEAFHAAFELRGGQQLQGRPGPDGDGEDEGALGGVRRAQGPSRQGADGVSARVDDDALDASREPHDVRRRVDRLCRGARSYRRRAAGLHHGQGAAFGDIQEARAVRDGRRVQRRRDEGHGIRADIPVLRRQAGGGRLPRAQRRLCDDRRRRRHSAYRAGVRRGRFSRVPRGRGRGFCRPARRRVRVHGRHPRIQGPLLQGLRQGHNQDAQGGRQARPPGDDNPLVSVLRQDRHAAHLPRHRRVVRARGRPARASREEQLRRALDARLRRREALRQLARRGARLEHLAQPLLGKLHTGVGERGRPGGHDMRRVRQGA